MMLNLNSYCLICIVNAKFEYVHIEIAKFEYVHIEIEEIEYENCNGGEYFQWMVLTQI